MVLWLFFDVYSQYIYLIYVNNYVHFLLWLNHIFNQSSKFPPVIFMIL